MSAEILFLPPGPVPLTSGGLEIVRPLGRVGDGLVYEARDRGVPARLREYAPAGVVRRALDGALEPVDEEFDGAWAAALGRFVEQGQRLSGFSQPGVAAVWRVEAVETADGPGGAWLVGAPAGRSLTAALMNGPGFTPADVVRIAGELADALAELHARGLTHLDISPETVSLASGRVQLGDFAVDNRTLIALLQGPEGLVRPGYSAIEHYDAEMSEPLGPPADVFAASALLHHLITGRAPPSWQERWRDPEALLLPDRDDYPPGFLAAIRQGLAIEPGDRFANGAAWRAALSLPRRIAGSATPVMEPEPVPSRRSKAPLLVALALLAIALLGFLAYQFHWLVPARQEPIANGSSSGGTVNRTQSRPPPPVPVLPQVSIGGAASGQLAGGDEQAADGSYRDQFTLRGVRGDRIALTVRANGFEPVVAISGPGLEPQLGGGGRLTATLPQDGSYTISVTATRPGATGDYALEVAPAPRADDGRQAGPIDPAVAARLAGTWRSEDDESCEVPAVNSVSGDILTARIGDETYRHHIVGAQGNTVGTTLVDGEPAGRPVRFELAPDGRSYEAEDEIWYRC
jgi:hypothetical protein